MFLYFNDEYLQCAREGDWKLHVSRYDVPMFTPTPERGRRNLPLARPELYNVYFDRQEAYARFPLLGVNSYFGWYDGDENHETGNLAELITDRS